VSAGGGLTVLLCDDDHTASKAYACQPDGSWRKTADYDAGFVFGAMARECPDLQALAALIEDIRTDGNAIIVRGELDDAGRGACEEADARDRIYKITRRKNDKGDGIPAHLTEVPRQWVMLDIDGWPLPPGADLVSDPTAVIDEAIHALLPQPFHDAECFWQLSSSAGFAAGVLKAHPFFWLSEPHDNAYLRAWFRCYAPLVDWKAPFSAVQPHYITDPTLTGGADPLPVRTGWRHGAVSEVTLPPLPDVTDARAHAGLHRKNADAGAAGLHAASIDGALARLGDGDGLDGFHQPLLAASMQYCIRSQKGGTRNDEKFIAGLRAAIAAAPMRDGRDVAGYLDGVYLHRIINGAFCLIGNAAKSDATDAAKSDPPLKLPTGFGMTRDGLYFVDPAKDDANPEWVCQEFSVLGECENGMGSEWGVVISWQDAALHRHTWIVPRELVHGEPHVIAARLESQGLRCNFVKAAQANLRRCVASVRPERRLTAVTCGGWHGMNFVLPDGTVFGGDNLILRPEMVRADLSCASRGSLQDWQDRVARYAVGNSRIAFFLAAGFAGPLLEFISEPSGGLHLFGPSRIGKTTAAVCAASVIGKGGRGGAIHQWRHTGNGLEAVVAGNSDNLLVLDEIGQADAKEAGNIVYMLANESGKLRMTKNITARPTASWCIMFLSTGEITLEQKMTEAGKRAMTGTENRLVNIRADAGAGLGVFENLHGFDEPALLADHLRHAAATFYGAAGRAFLSRLVTMRTRDPDGCHELVKALRQQFISDHLPCGSDGQVRSVAGRFGVVAAAGELATEWGILPWEIGEATQAATICFQAWLAGRGGIGAGEVQAAIRQVRAFFEQHGTSRFPEIRAACVAASHRWQQKLDLNEAADHIDEWRTINRCGWRRRDGAGWEFLVLSEAWKSEVCRGIDGEMAAKALADRSLLKREGKNLTCKVTIPEHGRPRVYVVSGALLEGDAD
jgi:putative DNA primase/helicase